MYKNATTLYNGQTLSITFPENIIGDNAFIFVQVNSNDSTSLTDVDILFNSLTNIPSLPISNSLFCINNKHRIKTLIITSHSCTCELLVLVTDKFIPTQLSMPYDIKP